MPLECDSKSRKTRLSDKMQKEAQMNNLDELLRSMTFEFFGAGKHKIERDAFLATKVAFFLDVRSRQEWESLQIKLEHHINVLWIPIDEVPSRWKEIPRDPTVGVFCSAGTRSTIVYLYLRSKGYQNVRIAPSTYDAITNLLLPGKLFKVVRERTKTQYTDGHAS